MKLKIELKLAPQNTFSGLYFCVINLFTLEIL